MQLVGLRNLIPSLHVDLVYATHRNFTKTILYENAEAYMAKRAAEALANVERDLNRKGLGLKIYDAFRPFAATCKIWRLVPDRRYAANPAKGSDHNRGRAVDLTIVDLKTGEELDMGTGFDNFTDTAHHSFAFLPAQVISNRKLLRQTMWRHGFSGVPTEGWHYKWKTTEQMPVLNLSCSDLKECQ